MLFLEYHDSIKRYVEEAVASTSFTDIHQSILYKNALADSPKMVPLSLTTDGGRYSKTGLYEGWPLTAVHLDLPLKLRHLYSNVIFLAYWYSRVKPNWEFIFKKIGNLKTITINGEKYKIKFLQFIADIPARQHLLSMVNVQGYDSCFNCIIHGLHKGQ